MWDRIILDSLSKAVELVFEGNRKVCRLLRRHNIDLFGGVGFPRIMRDLISKTIATHQPSMVLEVGGYDRPLIDKTDQNFTFHGIDVAMPDRTNDIYDKFIHRSIENPLEDRYDFIYSISVLEHIKNNYAVFANMYKSLNPGSVMIHYCPCRYHVFALITRTIGHDMQRLLIKFLRPHASNLTGYKVYYDHCSPRKMTSLAKEIGFKKVHIIEFWRGSDYFEFFLPLYLLMATWDVACKTMKLSSQSSGFIISCQKC